LKFALSIITFNFLNEKDRSLDCVADTRKGTCHIMFWGRMSSRARINEIQAAIEATKNCDFAVTLAIGWIILA
jgi:hypothetical protein